MDSCSWIEVDMAMVSKGGRERERREGGREGEQGGRESREGREGGKESREGERGGREEVKG